MRRHCAVFVLAFTVCPVAFATTDLAPGAAPGTPSSGEGSFPIVFEIYLAQDDYCVGVGFDGEYFWVSAGDQMTGTCHFYIYDDGGNLIDTQPQGAGATGWGHRDLTWDGNYMYGSYSNLVDGFSDPTTFEGYFIGPINPCRALACEHYCSYHGDFYTCGFGEHLWRMTWDGTWGTSAFVEDLGGPWDGAYGLAYHCFMCALWMTTADYSGDLFLIDLDGGLIETYTTLPEYDIHGGCTMARCQWGSVLCVLMQSSPDVLVFYDVPSGPSAVEDASWGRIKSLFR